MDIQITGLQEVQRRLTEAPSVLVEKVFTQALDRAAGVIAAELEARTPVGEEEELAENVIVKVAIDPGKRGGTAAVGFSSRQSSRTGKPFDLIALWVEYGHRLLSHKRKAIGHVPAHPFMRPAALASADKAAETFADVLIENLKVIGE